MADAPRTPPSSQIAEKSVLGAMMLSQEALSAAAESLRADDFYYDTNARIFGGMTELFRQGQPVDFITISDKLEKNGTLDALGGYDYLVELNRFVPTAANVEEYIRIVSEKSRLRQLITATEGILQACYAQETPLAQILEQAERAIFNVTQQHQIKKFIHVREAVDEAIEQVEILHNDPDALAGIRVGFNYLDYVLGGMRRGELILIGARPSMGKTALELCMAHQAARLNRDAPIALFSLEMPARDLASRMLASVGNLPLQNLRSGRMAEGADWQKLDNAATILGKTAIYIDDTSSISVTEIRSKCRRLKLQKGLGMVMIDYLQLLTAGRSADNRQLEVSEMTRALKIMARELDVPVVLLSQLSRAPERREDKRPLLSDLRESGAIEQDADVVMFIHREGYYTSADADTDQSAAEIIVAKNRNGPTVRVNVRWEPDTASYRDIPQEGQFIG